MEIHYQPDPTDLEALNAFVHRGTLAGWLMKRPAVFVGVLIVFLGAVLFRPDSPVISTLVVLLALGFFIFFWSRRHVALRKKGTAIFSPVALTTTAEGIQVAATGRSSTTTWLQVKGYGETATHIFVMIDALAGHVIPKRDLSPEQLAALHSELRSYSKPLPSSAESRYGGAFRLVLLWLVLLLALITVFYAISPRR